MHWSARVVERAAVEHCRLSRQYQSIAHRSIDCPPVNRLPTGQSIAAINRSPTGAIDCPPINRLPTGQSIAHRSIDCRDQSIAHRRNRLPTGQSIVHRSIDCPPVNRLPTGQSIAHRRNRLPTGQSIAHRSIDCPRRNRLLLTACAHGGRDVLGVRVLRAAPRVEATTGNEDAAMFRQMVGDYSWATMYIMPATHLALHDSEA